MNENNSIDQIDLSPKEDNGILKTIIKEGRGNTVGKDVNVNVHYVGTLQDGTEFDSSRKRNDFFKFKVGAGSVIKAWDLGVASMKIGEICNLKCAPQYAYGKNGSPPTIPANATLNFEIELISLEGEDVSDDADGSVKKITLESPENKYATPNERANVSIDYILFINEKKICHEKIEFDLGEEHQFNIPRSIGKSLLKFGRGDKSQIFLKESAYEDQYDWIHKHAENIEQVKYEICLLDFKNRLNYWEMELNDMLESANKLKALGNDAFKQKKYHVAKNYYTIVPSIFKLVDEPNDEIKNLNLTSYLNCAMCLINLNKFNDAIKVCDSAIEIDANNEKALYRRAKALCGMKCLDLAISDCKTILKISPNNNAASLILSQCYQIMKQEKENEKKLYKKVFDRQNYKLVKTKQEKIMDNIEVWDNSMCEDITGKNVKT
ncbi:Rotamase [Intoshia linei]|uniref:peptidylprolyl isomerase n=1 Tax=Intoshia linei TaxID=1819745 RepID=A0A177B7I6_9BILA|nr:Rotamase [Intoshia linei]